MALYDTYRSNFRNFSAKKGVFMSLKSFIYNISNRLGSETSVQSTCEHRSEHPLTRNESSISPPVATLKRNVGGRPSVDFNLVEALRLREMGWSNRKIARKMNNVSKDTVRNRLMEYDARKQAQQPKPLIPATAPALKSPSIPAPAAPKPPAPVQDTKRTGCAPDLTLVPPEKGSPDPPDEPVPVPVNPPEPIDNYKAIVAYWASRGVPDFVPDTRCFFLVRGQQNVAYATNCEQLCVGIDQWYKAYRDLEAFQTAERIWVILDPREDNRAFLQSLAADIWIRERCMIGKWEVPSICKYRLLWERAHRSPLPSSLMWLQAAWSDFEKVHNFIPIPAPNCTEQLNALLAKPREPEQPARLDGGYPMAGINRARTDR
jgi:hypothetical protein